MSHPRKNAAGFFAIDPGHSRVPEVHEDIHLWRLRRLALVGDGVATVGHQISGRKLSFIPRKDGAEPEESLGSDIPGDFFQLLHCLDPRVIGHG